MRDVWITSGMRCRCRDLWVVHVGSAGLVGTAPPFVPGFPSPRIKSGAGSSLVLRGGCAQRLAVDRQWFLVRDSYIPCERAVREPPLRRVPFAVRNGGTAEALRILTVRSDISR